MQYLSGKAHGCEYPSPVQFDLGARFFALEGLGSRQVEADEVLGELEITALTADFRQISACAPPVPLQSRPLRDHVRSNSMPHGAAHRTPALRCR